MVIFSYFISPPWECCAFHPLLQILVTHCHTNGNAAFCQRRISVLYDRSPVTLVAGFPVN